MQQLIPKETEKYTRGKKNAYKDKHSNARKNIQKQRQLPRESS